MTWVSSCECWGNEAYNQAEAALQRLSLSDHLSLFTVLTLLYYPGSQGGPSVPLVPYFITTNYHLPFPITQAAKAALQREAFSRQTAADRRRERARDLRVLMGVAGDGRGEREREVRELAGVGDA